MTIFIRVHRSELSVHSLSWSGLSLQRYKSLNMSENTWNIDNTYKRTANPMYNLLVVLIYVHNLSIQYFEFVVNLLFTNYFGSSPCSGASTVNDGVSWRRTSVNSYVFVKMASWLNYVVLYCIYTYMYTYLLYRHNTCINYNYTYMYLWEHPSLPCSLACSSPPVCLRLNVFIGCMANLKRHWGISSCPAVKHNDSPRKRDDSVVCESACRFL